MSSASPTTLRSASDTISKDIAQTRRHLPHPALRSQGEKDYLSDTEVLPMSFYVDKTGKVIEVTRPRLRRRVGSQSQGNHRGGSQLMRRTLATLALMAAAVRQFGRAQFGMDAPAKPRSYVTYAADAHTVPAGRTRRAAASLPAAAGIPRQLAHSQVFVPDPDRAHASAGRRGEAG